MMIYENFRSEDGDIRRIVLYIWCMKKYTLLIEKYEKFHTADGDVWKIILFKQRRKSVIKILSQLDTLTNIFW